MVVFFVVHFCHNFEVLSDSLIKEWNGGNSQLFLVLVDSSHFNNSITEPWFGFSILIRPCMKNAHYSDFPYWFPSWLEWCGLLDSRNAYIPPQELPCILDSEQTRIKYASFQSSWFHVRSQRIGKNTRRLDQPILAFEQTHHLVVAIRSHMQLVLWMPYTRPHSSFLVHRTSLS